MPASHLLVATALWVTLSVPAIVGGSSHQSDQTPAEPLVSAAVVDWDNLVKPHEDPRERTAGYVSERFKVSRAHARQVVSLSFEHAERLDLDPNLVLAVIAVESRFRPQVVSHAGAQGLMQIIPVYHQKLLREVNHDITDPRANIYVGTKILREYIDLSQTLNGALLRYNGSLGDPKSRYAQKVFDELEKFNSI